MINEAKGKIMRSKASSDLDTIKKDAKAATTTDTKQAYDTLMRQFQLTIATWEYMRVFGFGIQFNLVGQGVHSHLGLANACKTVVAVYPFSLILVVVMWYRDKDGE